MQNQKPVRVYNKARMFVGHVSSNTTSVGAAKLAGTQTAALTKIGRRTVWLGKDYR